MAEGAPRKWLDFVVALAVVVVLVLSAVLFVYLIAHNESGVNPVVSLRIGSTEAVTSLNPFVGTSLSDKIVYGLVYDCLYGVGEDMEPEPNLALDCFPVSGHNPNGSVWQYNLTSSARWHDGVEFTAADVVFTVNLNAEGVFWPYEPYAHFIDFAEAIDNRTVLLHFHDPSTGNPIPVSFADSVFIPILPKHMLQNMTAAEIGFSWTGVFEDAEIPLVGTGPFMATADTLRDWTENNTISLVKNQAYHRKADRGEEISFDRLEFLYFRDPLGLSVAAQTGFVDVASVPPDKYVQICESVEDGELHDLVTHGGASCVGRQAVMSFFGTSRFESSICDSAVRLAISMATNRSIIVDEAYLGLADEGTTLISSADGEWHYGPTEDETLVFDPVGAAELLDEHGYTYTEGSPDVRVATHESISVQNGWVEENASLTFSFLIMPEEYHLKEAVDSWISDWADLGVAINLTAFVGPAIPLTLPQYDIRITDDIVCHPDPCYRLFQQYSDGLYCTDYYHYSNDTYDECFLESVQQLDDSERLSSVRDCQRVYYLDAAAIVLAYPHQTYVFRTDAFGGWGDWEENPGRSLDAFWSGNQLYFDLEPIRVYDSNIPSLMMAIGGVATIVVAYHAIRHVPQDIVIMQPT